MNNKVVIFLTSITVWLTPLHPFFIIMAIIMIISLYLETKQAQRKKYISILCNILYRSTIYATIIILGYMIDIYLIGDFIRDLSNVELTSTRAFVIGVITLELINVDKTMIHNSGKGLRHYVREVFKVIKVLNNERKEF